MLETVVSKEVVVMTMEDWQKLNSMQRVFLGTSRYLRQLDTVHETYLLRPVVLQETVDTDAAEDKLVQYGEPDRVEYNQLNRTAYIFNKDRLVRRSPNCLMGDAFAMAEILTGVQMFYGTTKTY